MSRKVFIGFLGTGGLNEKNLSVGRYKTAEYEIDGKRYISSFVSQALTSHFDIKTQILIGTMKSMWDEVYKTYALDSFIESEYEDLIDLANNSNKDTQIDSTKLSKIEDAIGNNSKIIPIKYGLNQAEIKENLELILLMENYLQDSDELYLDITHGFRSLSIFITTTLVYLKDVSNKNLKIVGIYYGMLDVINEVGYAPIVNLNIVDKMIDWSKAAYSFMNFGNGILLSKLAKSEENDLNLSNKIENLTNSIQIAYFEDVKNSIESLDKLKLNLSIPANLIIPKVVNEIKVILIKSKEIDSSFQILLSEWYCEKKMYALSYILLAESVVTYVCEKENYLSVSDKHNRDKAKSLIWTKYSNVLNDKNLYSTINEIRNDIAHASIGKRNSMIMDVRELKTRVEKYKKIIVT